MNIKEFCAHYGGNTRKFLDVVGQWQLAELDGLLRALQKQHDQMIGSAVIAGDAMHGDGMLDEIPAPLRDAFAKLMGEEADTYAEMRKILLDHITSDEGRFLRLDSREVIGFVSKIKGQIGENVFKEQVGRIAELAPSGCQEGWDVVIKNPGEAYDYVQVKLYAEPHGVIKHMLSVQEKVVRGLEGYKGHMVDRVDFAVPADIADKVRELKDQYPQLESMQVLTINKINAHEATGIVQEGMGNVGPEELENFFGELCGGALAAGSLHALVNGFLWYKGSKELSAAVAEVAANTTISSVGIGLGLGMDALFHVAAFSGVVGVGGRLLLGRLAKSRWSFAEFLENSIAETRAKMATLRPDTIGLAAQ